MTELSPSPKDEAPPPSDSVAGHGAFASRSTFHSKSLVTNTEEEEDYTIKCICGFHDDDGNTVFCDRCETWQHTECYYFEGGEVPDVSEIDHWCVECVPRSMDSKGARERQTLRREQSDLGERRLKKPATKSHKKKIKAIEPNATLTNGSSHDRSEILTLLHDRGSGSPRDQYPPAKKPKTSHRPSGSLNSPTAPWMVPGSVERRLGSSSRLAQSPSKHQGKTSPPCYPNELYSPKFLHLYDNDPGYAAMQANLFNDISITQSLSTWTQDASSLAQATNGLSPQDIFHRCEQSLDSMLLPQLRKEQKQDDKANGNGQCPKWIFLSVDEYVPKGSIVGELKGKIGHMHDYAKDPTNRWDYLRHPVPFVFFHPKLPIYIDTRHEGSICRYLRRSCRPNLTMWTILENGSDYRFCFVAKENLEAESELTIGWTLDEHIRNFFHPRNGDENIIDADEDYVADWVGKVLADFGGCACNVPNECSLARYDRRVGLASSALTASMPNGTSVKGRNGYKRSPPSNDGMVHGRFVGMKMQDDADMDDGRSTSDSTRSKPHSRDMTPTRQGSNDIGSFPGLELSDREKRKIAAMEKNFEQREHDKMQTAQKRKKRNSGSAANTPSLSISKGHPYPSFAQPDTPIAHSGSHSFFPESSRWTSGSPVDKSANALSNLGKPTARKKRQLQHPFFSENHPPARRSYVTSSVQTESNDDLAWYKAPGAQPQRQPYRSLTKRLLIRCQQDRMKLEQRLKAETSNAVEIPSEKASNGEIVTNHHSFAENETSLLQSDVKMGDADNLHVEDASLNVAVLKPRPPDSAEYLPTKSSPLFNPPPPKLTLVANGHHPANPNFQRPPSPQPITEPTSVPSPANNVPLPTSDRIPFAAATTNPFHPAVFTAPTPNAVQPSPVKKVSLGEYISRRGNNSNNNNNKTEGLASAAAAAAAADKLTGSSSSLVLQQRPLKNVFGFAKEGSTTEAATTTTMTGIVTTDGPKEERNATTTTTTTTTPQEQKDAVS
ncbi:MAG: hypothetical protein Q9190_005413 [Brigantiaea leucoxantha]